MATIAAKDPKITDKDLAAREERRRREVAMAAKLRDLWGALNHFVHVNGGWVTSPPLGKSLRIEVLPGSDLVDRLADRGFDLRPAGTGTRIEGGIIMPVRIYNLKLGK